MIINETQLISIFSIHILINLTIKINRHRRKKYLLSKFIFFHKKIRDLVIVKKTILVKNNLNIISKKFALI